MNAYIQQVLDVLEELLASHRQLIVHGNEKKDAIVAGNVGTISAILSREKKCVEQVTAQEQKRMILVRNYVLEQGQRTKNNFTMDKLIQLVFHADEKVALQSKWKELSAVIKELKDVNDFNQQIVRLNLERVHFTQDLLFGPIEEDVTYHRALQDNKYNRNGRFNMKM